MEIIVNGVTKKIDDNIVLKDVDLKLESGKIYGFIGRNGSGKSILFKTICGFIKPQEGTVVIGGEDIYKNNTFPKNTAALIENPTFLKNLTGYENLKLLASINNIIGEKEIKEILKDVGLFDEKDKKFKKYSLGMKRKLGIAQTLMEDPDIIILDEPFNGLDEKSVKTIRKIILNKKEEGKLVLLASHIKEDVEVLCDHVFKLDAGKIVEGYKK